MKTFALELAIALVLTGCATATPVEISPEAHSYHVECAAGRTDLCYAKAAQLCPNGFDEVKNDKGPPPALPPSPDEAAAAEGAQTTLLISCK